MSSFYKKFLNFVLLQFRRVVKSSAERKKEKEEKAKEERERLRRGNILFVMRLLERRGINFPELFQIHKELITIGKLEPFSTNRTDCDKLVEMSSLRKVNRDRYTLSEKARIPTNGKRRD